jgi:glutaminyl-peptide cyclotransferase
LIKIVTVFFIVLTASCNNSHVKDQTPEPNNTNVPQVINYSVLSAFPHDTAAFTEGLLIHDGLLFESTGHTDSYPNSRSLFGVLDLNTGRNIYRLMQKR